MKQDDQERLKLVKPVRRKSGKRIDGYAALCNAIRTYTLWIEEKQIEAASGSRAAIQAANDANFFRPNERLAL